METVASLIEALKKYPKTTPIVFFASETETMYLASIYSNENKLKPAVYIDMEYE